MGPLAVLVEHVGSTSVPGLVAKPIIDALLLVPDPTDEAAYVPPLEAAGFLLHLREPDWHQHRLLKARDPEVNLHVFAEGSEEAERMLLFRDRLRASSAERRIYEETKRRLAARNWKKVQDYADAKSDVVEDIIARARGLCWPGSVRVVDATGEQSIALRPLHASDMDALFRQMSDPESVRMAAFTPEDPDDRQRFDAHMSRVLSSPGSTNRAITRNGELVGMIASFVVDQRTEVTYWVDRSVWGRGIAGQALALLLEEVRTRPVYARAASDNAGSLRVLEKNGFQVVGTDVGFASGRDADIEETILRLD